jgi:tetratricopeptide (TPR) repeat protein
MARQISAEVGPSALGYGAQTTNAIPFDDGGRQKPAGPVMITQEELKKDPDRFIREMKEELRRGSLQSVATLGAQLLEIKPDDPALRSLYGLWLATQGRPIGAREHWSQGRSRSGNEPLVHYAEAMILRQEGQQRQAIPVCQRAIRLDERHPYPWNILGGCYLDLGDRTNALVCFMKAVELAPAFAPGYKNLGATTFALGDFAESQQWFRKAVDLTPRDPRVHYGAALACEALGDAAQAIEQLNQTLRYAPDDPAVLLKLGEVQVQQGRYDEALQTGQKMQAVKAGGAVLLLANACLHKGDLRAATGHLAGLAENDPDRHCLEGYCFMVEGQYGKALQSMENALKADPTHLGAYSARAALKVCLGQQLDARTELTNHWDASVGRLLVFIQASGRASRGEWRPALEGFQAAEGLVPGFAMTGIDASILAAGVPRQKAGLLSLGVLFYLNNLDAPASAAFQEALKSQPYSFMANYWAAITCLKRKDRPQALEALQKATQRAPNFFAALYAIGELHFGLGKPALAADYYRRAQAVKPDPGLALRLGLYYENSGDPLRAKEAYRTVIKLAPDLFLGYNQLAWLLVKRGEDLDEALKLARKADALQPGNASILDTLGWVCYRKGQYAEADQHLQKATSINPADPVIWYHLGAVCQARSERERAKTALQKALQLSDKFEDAAEARRLLGDMAR